MDHDVITIGGGMGFGLTAKETLEVLIVPVVLAVLALLWPAIAARQRRRNFEELIRRELAEAAPKEEQFVAPGTPWHQHLTRRFLHEQVIRHPVENTEFVLSLNPALAYHLSQMWVELDKAQADTGPATDHAREFHWHLKQVAKFLDRKRGPINRLRCRNLTRGVWKLWHELIEKKNPEALKVRDTTRRRARRKCAIIRGRRTDRSWAEPGRSGNPE